MSNDKLTQRSADLINWVDDQIGEPTLPHDPRTTTSAILCSLGRQHHRAIIRLIECDLPASAAALLRVIFESYVRAVWIQACATDDEVRRAINDDWPRFKPMIEAIEQNPRLQNGVLQATFDARWKVLNSFTHNGTIALARQIKNREIAPHYSESEVRDVVRFSDALNLMIAGHMAVLAQNIPLAQTLLAKVQEYSKAV